VKTFKILLAWLFGTLILLQFIRVDVPPPPEASENDEVKAPKEVKTILKKACYDCHSNHTKWPWYSYISPVSIEINSNVKNGRAWLNFSIWNKYSEAEERKTSQRNRKGYSFGKGLQQVICGFIKRQDLQKRRERLLKTGQKQIRKNRFKCYNSLFSSTS